jgi:hypothetical protein
MNAPGTALDITPAERAAAKELRRAEDRDRIRARTLAWLAFEEESRFHTRFESFQAALDVYHRELVFCALRRMGTGL